MDVKREVDVVEEVLRIYGYNNIELPEALHSSLAYAPKPDPEKIKESISDLLSNNGFNEIITNSLTKGAYYADKMDKAVVIQNSLSSDLNVLRQSFLFTGLEAISYNINRKNQDLKFFEFGKTYSKAGGKYMEESHLGIFMTGREQNENWKNTNEPVTIYSLKSAAEGIISRLGINDLKINELKHDHLEGFMYASGKTNFAIAGKVKKSTVKSFDIKQDVYSSLFKWDIVHSLLISKKIEFSELNKFPEVRRDLALLVDKHIKYEQLEQLAFQTEKKLLKQVDLFDVFEGEKIEKGKRSYAMRFILQDVNATLTDKQIDQVMEKLQKVFEEKTGASIRK